MNPLRTGEVARLAGVSHHTVRYYEDRGLLPKPSRSRSGYREYGAEHVAHIRFVKRAQELGFTLEEIRDLLALRAEPGAGAEVREMAAEKIAEIEAKVRDLQCIRAKLEELLTACAHHGSNSDCRVLHALEDPEAFPRA